MRPRTLVGILFALLVVVTATYLSNRNIELLTGDFALTSSIRVPVWAVLLGVFLVGFLPAVGALVTQTLKRDLAQRRERRRSREVKSLAGSFRRAVDFQEDGQWGRAAAELESFLKDKPEDFAGLVRYGEVLRFRGQNEAALEVHRRASVLYPRSVAVLYQLAEDYEALGDSEVAHQIRDRILRDFPGVGLRILRRRRNAALAARDWAEAARHQSRVEAMLAEADDAAELEREAGVRLGLLYEQGVESLRAGQVAEAQRAFDQVLEEEPLFIPALIMRGEAKRFERDGSAAVAIWSDGFETTGSPVFLQRIEDYFIEREQPLQAIENLHRMIASSSREAIPRFFLGRLYHRLEMHDEALKVLSGLEEEFQASPTYHYLVARIHQRRGEVGRALEALFAGAREAGLSITRYVCSVCGEHRDDWQARCDSCQSWNSVELELEGEARSIDEPTARRAAVEVHHGARPIEPEEA